VKRGCKNQQCVVAPDFCQTQKAVQHVEQARKGSTSATPLAHAAFGELLAADPNNPLYMAYYGSTFALQAHQGHIPWKQIIRSFGGTGAVVEFAC
jgi:hypothetical protein